MKYFITGVAGFVGFHLCRSLLAQGAQVVGFDGITPYYDPALKRARVQQLNNYSNFSFREGMLEDKQALDLSVGEFEPDVIIHLAAQAGVRYSIEHPDSYIDSNLVGTFNVLELARRLKPKHLLFSSTSSIYGGNEVLPFQEVDGSHLPLSLYAATKKAGEVMSHSYSHLFQIPTTCFRFFTVYGPWGRPDMALFKFVDRMDRNEPIDVYGEGRMSRDFTYVDDLVHAVVKLADVIPDREIAPLLDEDGSKIDSLSPVAPWRAVNIGGGNPVILSEFIEAVEEAVGKKAIKNMLPIQPGDPWSTKADSRLLNALIGFTPSTSIRDGVKAFVAWYREYHV